MPGPLPIARFPPPPAAQYIDEGVIPVGATWARNPVPLVSGGAPGCSPPPRPGGHPAGAVVPGNATITGDGRRAGQPCRAFEPPCGAAVDAGWATTPGSSDPSDVMGACSNNWVDGVVVDTIVVDGSWAPGEYVLGWRWDCEQTSQVWSSCADVTIVAE